ncbi:MAG: hypothetical protein A3F72_17860 [Bacteroidetes bacterium RIFCSPLOWO2_12_FULL_35_15]|nr:MAG: hypothetical protein A3F72_17860 [Bacteroidetes bacterium RIFCSPLOWO2_12_FULL_35_15]
MRVFGIIPHPKITITVFSMNDKYQLKFEAGPMEQTFKIAQNEINGMEGIKKLLDAEFMQKIMERFNEMFLSFKAAKERNG